MKILITGASGLVGSRFVELSKFKSFITAPSSSELDITELEDLRKFSSDVIINFAAYTNVSEGESQRGDKTGECWQVNVDGVKNILEAIIGSKTKFIQISTEYVFSGSKDDPGPYAEDHKPEKVSSKLTWYGFTKAKAERLVFDRLKEKTTIVRLVYPVRAKFDQKPDYLRKMLKLFDEGKIFPLFTDTKISISFIDDLCLLLDRIIETGVYGVFHCASRDMASPFKLCSYLLEKTRGVQNIVRPALYSDFLKTTGNPVRYPQFGGLKIKKTEEKLGLKFSTWKEIINKLAEQRI